MYQHITLIGNLGRDPELRYTPAGMAVSDLSMATKESWKDQSGEKQERTTWWKVSVWGKQAESCKRCPFPVYGKYGNSSCGKRSRR